MITGGTPMAHSITPGIPKPAAGEDLQDLWPKQPKSKAYVRKMQAAVNGWCRKKNMRGFNHVQASTDTSGYNMIELTTSLTNHFPPIRELFTYHIHQIVITFWVLIAYRDVYPWLSTNQTFYLTINHRFFLLFSQILSLVTWHSSWILTMSSYMSQMFSAF